MKIITGLVTYNSEVIQENMQYELLPKKFLTKINSPDINNDKILAIGEGAKNV